MVRKSTKPHATTPNQDVGYTEILSNEAFRGVQPIVLDTIDDDDDDDDLTEVSWPAKHGAMVAILCLRISGHEREPLLALMDCQDAESEDFLDSLTTQVEEEPFSLSIELGNDDDSLAQQMRSLSNWCAGFLTVAQAYLHQHKDRLNTSLSEAIAFYHQTGEMLSNIDFDEVLFDEEGSVEEYLSDFETILEHARLCAVNVFFDQRNDSDDN